MTYYNGRIQGQFNDASLWPAIMNVCLHPASKRGVRKSLLAHWTPIRVRIYFDAACEQAGGYFTYYLERVIIRDWRNCGTWRLAAAPLKSLTTRDSKLDARGHVLELSAKDRRN